MRNILAATGESGGISAEQILRQFNARRFKEASKAWSAAAEADRGSAAGSDPLDPLFFVPPTAPTGPPGQPSSTPASSPSQHQHQQSQHQQSQSQSQNHHHHHHHQQPSISIPLGAAPATECAGGASGSAFCSADGTGEGVDASRAYFAARAKAFGGDGSVRQQQQYRRPCGGGWVC